MNTSTEPTANAFKYTAKELSLFRGLPVYDYTARHTLPAIGNQFRTMDPFAEKFYGISPLTFCMGDPVNFSDPTGCEVRGASKKDASLIVQDIRKMFPGDDFAEFRELIVQSGKKQNGKSLANISSESLASALSGLDLTEDQQALIDMVVNTINSADVHIVEYFSAGSELSQTSLSVLEPKLHALGITSELAANTPGGYGTFIVALLGEGATSPTSNGTLSLIQKESKSFVTNRPATLGHEVIGHGRSYCLGYTDSQSQHIIPIQTENLILRNMGIPIQRDGTDHAPLKTFIRNFNSLPICR